jgi:hypothetical protein
MVKKQKVSNPIIKPLQESVWNQFGASLEALQNAIKLCPDQNWDTEKRFWIQAYHCLFFTDYYLTLDAAAFVPPPPFTYSEFEDQMPDHIYSKEELLTYLHYCRGKAKDIFLNANIDLQETRWKNTSGSMDYSLLELLLYNMRHIQHHAAQLNLILRQDIQDAPNWVSRATQSL